MVQKVYLKIVLIVLFYELQFFDNFILAKEPFAKAIRSFETCVLVNSNLWGKLFSALKSPTTFDETFKVTSASFFILSFPN